MGLLATASRWPRWAPPAAAVLLVLTSLAIRASLEQRDAWDRAVAFEAAGNTERAIEEYRWTLRWYTPWGPPVAAATLALVDLAQRHAAEDPETAVQAWDALRSGLIAARSLYQPHAELVERASRELPPLLVRVADRRGDRRDPTKLLARFQADYARPVGVNPWTSLAVTLGFVAWIGGLWWSARRGVDTSGHWQRAGWQGIGIALVGFATWATAMWLA